MEAFRVRATRKTEPLVFGNNRGNSLVFASKSPGCAWNCALWNEKHYENAFPGAICLHEIVCIEAIDYFEKEEIPKSLKNGDSPLTDSDEIFVLEGRIIKKWDLTKSEERKEFKKLLKKED